MSDDFARELRHNMTEPEVRLWRQLSRKQLGGFKFRKQHRINGLVADFFCPSIGLIVEVDGDTHDVEDDAVRDHNMLSIGFTTLRFGNGDVMTNMEGVCETILAKALSLPLRWPG
ncbi:endonuclease domain-containing protein [uncultured Sphingomonas sp.]|uniref:endonuclease domain-containing protein n=1 Tax=uncultured Sphingomonas sp. TaxID=158754 RepID=UPI0035CBBDA1